MNLKLAILVIIVLVALLVWTFVAPYVVHWKARRAAARRRMTTRRK